MVSYAYTDIPIWGISFPFRSSQSRVPRAIWQVLISYLFYTWYL